MSCLPLPAHRQKATAMIVLVEPPPQYDHPIGGRWSNSVCPCYRSWLCQGPAAGCAFVDKGVRHIALPSDEKDECLMARWCAGHEIIRCNGPAITRTATRSSTGGLNACAGPSARPR